MSSRQLVTQAVKPSWLRRTCCDARRAILRRRNAPKRQVVHRRACGCTPDTIFPKISLQTANVRLYGRAIGWQRCKGRNRRKKHASYDLRVIHDGGTERRRNGGCLRGSCGWSSTVKRGRAFGSGHPCQRRLRAASASRSARALPPRLTLPATRKFRPAAEACQRPVLFRAPLAPQAASLTLAA